MRQKIHFSDLYIARSSEGSFLKRILKSCRLLLLKIRIFNRFSLKRLYVFLGEFEPKQDCNLETDYLKCWAAPERYFKLKQGCQTWAMTQAGSGPGGFSVGQAVDGGCRTLCGGQERKGRGVTSARAVHGTFFPGVLSGQGVVLLSCGR